MLCFTLQKQQRNIIKEDRYVAKKKPPIGSKVIRIDNEVYDKLKNKSEGFESPNNVLRRLLGLQPRPRTGKKRTPT